MGITLLAKGSRRTGHVFRSKTAHQCSAKKYVPIVIPRRHYVGEINYVPLSKNRTYWLVPLESLTVQGTVIDMGRPDIAIDTGTSLIGGPEKDLKTIFAAVHDAKLVEDGNFKGYWTIPCATKLELSVQFGTISYPIDPLDTNLGKMNSGDRCLTSFFTINKSSSGRNIPEWIFGVAFLKNVYSVFRASPPAIGFAQLSREFVGYASSTPSLVEKSPAFQKQKKLGQTSKASTTRQKMRLSELVSTLILTCLAIRYL